LRYYRQAPRIARRPEPPDKEVREAEHLSFGTLKYRRWLGSEPRRRSGSGGDHKGALHDAGWRFPTRRVSVEPSSGDVIADSIRVGTQLKEVVRAVVADGNAPLVLAGSCDVAFDVLAGIESHAPA
jgi:hypothetical protein